ncbi:hypothetical protein GCM10010124_27780 [Pilimelia terevasa]|uniref:DUF2867 domain-containing protein n=1 Tax=Pilimelia terevasa TaxID=53372 RepID=A0A8J3BN94_9ACTN|nr:DUF2867 domain-containing protein [Pilimelia terevasa]GGK33495.1 hypothetical protein GCM10010124_27780 [Pilimelia terevasa]
MATGDTPAIRNVHERALPVPADRVGRLLDRLASADDPLWPSPTWRPVLLDRPLGVGAAGGHGAIRYRVTRYEPGRLLACAFDPAIGLTGVHVFEVQERGPDRCVIRHRLEGRPTGAMRLLWPLLVRQCHDAVVEHLLDNAERHVTGGVRAPVRYPWPVRRAAAAESVRVRAVPVPAGARLLRECPARRDLADAYSLRVPPGTSADPQDWADAVFRRPPPAVAALLRLRNALAPLVGVAPEGATAFDTLATGDGEVLLGTDAAHLDFRVSVLVAPGPGATTVTVSTVAAARTRVGRGYLALVRLAHPAVVRAMLRHAGREATAPQVVRRPPARAREAAR